MNLLSMLWNRKMESTPGTGGTTGTTSGTTSTTPSGGSEAGGGTPGGEAPAAPLSSGNSSFDDSAALFDSIASYDDMNPTPAAAPAAAAPSSVPAAPTAAAVPPAGTSVVPPVGTTPAVPPAAAVPPAQTPQAAATPPAPATQPAAPASQAPPAQPVTFEQHRTQHMPRLRELYAKSSVLTDPAMLEKIAANPAEMMNVLPDLAAQLHYEVTVSAYESVISAVPTLIAQVIQQRQVADDADKQFYTTWPKLRTSDPALVQKFDTATASAIRSVKHSNPNAPMDQVIKQAGMLAMMTLGIPLEDPSAPPASPAAAVGTPGFVAPQPQAPAAPRFRPAGVSAAGHVPLPGGGGNGLDPNDPINYLVEDTIAGRL